MRRLASFVVVLALCIFDYGAFAATRSSRGPIASKPSTQESQPQQPQQPVATTARAATARNAVKKQTTTILKPATVNTTNNARAATAGVAARAGTKQKAINLGTKVESAVANTVVSEECQNAYYGCMDSFCMLDNASGGRCQCSDRHTDLDAVLEDIMKLDEQSLAMATEGVERLQMGESAEEILSRAKAAADAVTGRDNSNSANGKKTVRKLDLSGWKNADLFSDSEIFDDASVFSQSEPGLTDKTGDALQNAAARLCTENIPNQCKDSASFLQLTYAQKIKSDCTAYENSLKQQRNQSAEKLQTAQKALRDAALEMYQNENKYDLGQCVVQFKNCMQTTGECGDDYSGCIADNAILGELYNKSGKGKKGVATTVIKTGSTSITISTASYDILQSKKLVCESVTKQCVNANKKGAVWNQVLKDLAPIVYTAEYNAASNSRMNCISTVVSCVQNVCASKWDENSDNYDACLSDPKSIDSYCSLEYKRCGDETAENNVRNYVMAKLAALKVDKCTKDVKACLLSEDRCGEDFAGCIGLDSDAIVDLCPNDLLLSCQDRANGGADAVREYIAQIAQGIALNIDNKMATACQNAVDAAYERVCGVSDDEESDKYCMSLSTDNKSIKGSLNIAFYDAAADKYEDAVNTQGFSINGSTRKFFNTVDEFIALKGLSIDAQDNNKKMVRVLDLVPIITGQLDVYSMSFDSKSATNNQDNSSFEYNPGNDMSLDNGFTGKKDDILAEMNTRYKSIISQIETDTTVKNCMVGRALRGFGGTTIGDDTGTKGRFTNLTGAVKLGVANQIIGQTIDAYNTEMDAARDKLVAAYDEVKNRYTKELKEKELDDINAKQCAAKRRTPDKSKHGGWKGPTWGISPTYDSSTNVCTLSKTKWYCYEYISCNMFHARVCGCNDWRKESESEESIQMDTLESLQNQQ